MPPSPRAPYKRHSQRGVALFTVLILLVVLAAASAVLIQSQRWSVRQIADRLEVLDQTAASSVLHDQCVLRMREGLEYPSKGSVLKGYAGGEGFISASDARWDSHADGCIFEWYQLPSDSVSAWTPHVRVTSRAQVGGRMMLEVSEWRYPACGSTGACSGRAVQQVNSDGLLEKSLNTQYGSGTIATARQPL